MAAAMAMVGVPLVATEGTKVALGAKVVAVAVAWGRHKRHTQSNRVQHRHQSKSRGWRTHLERMCRFQAGRYRMCRRMCRMPHSRRRIPRGRCTWAIVAMVAVAGEAATAVAAGVAARVAARAAARVAEARVAVAGVAATKDAVVMVAAAKAVAVEAAGSTMMAAAAKAAESAAAGKVAAERVAAERVTKTVRAEGAEGRQW